MASVRVVLLLASAPSLSVGRGSSLTPRAKRGASEESPVHPVWARDSQCGEQGCPPRTPAPLLWGLSEKGDKADSSGGTGHKLPNLFGPGCEPLT